MKIIIAGSREFKDYDFLREKMDKLLINQKEVEIVSGGCRGADILGEKYANEKGYKLKVFKANWYKFGRSAGPIRNREMAEYADGLVAFYKEGSKGTKNMIEEAYKNKIKVRIIKIL